MSDSEYSDYDSDTGDAFAEHPQRLPQDQLWQDSMYALYITMGAPAADFDGYLMTARRCVQQTVRRVEIGPSYTISDTDTTDPCVRRRRKP